jgi:hypothetical protein
MITLTLRPGSGRHQKSLRCVLGLALCLAALLAGSPPGLQAQTDNFDDATDNGWTRYNPFAAVGANIVRWHMTNGAYRILTTAPSPSNDKLGPGRAGSLRSEVYTNFYISVDFVNWNDNLPQAAGILARIRNAGLGSTDGYAFTWSRENPSVPTDGTVDISVIRGEDPSDVSSPEDGSVHLEPGKSYRFVFLGRGPNLEGRVYELPDITTPKVKITGIDTSFEFGSGGMVIYDNSTGGTNICDVTFDNFFATDVEPPTMRLESIFAGDWELSWPEEASTYILQESSTMLGSSWSAVPSAEIFLLGGRYFYFFTPLSSPSPRFFRLVKP